MKSGRQRRLGDICTLTNGRAFQSSEWSEDGLPIIRIQNLNDPSKPFNYYRGSLPEQFHVRPGDVLLSWSGTPGTSFGCFRWRGPEGWLNQHIFNVQMKEDILPDFFVYQVGSLLGELIARAHGGVGLQHVTKGMLEDLMLWIPSRVEQDRIVRLLDDAQALRGLRSKADERSAAIEPALFNEMFGSPSSEWPTDRLANLGALDRGKSRHRPRDEPSLLGGPYPFIQTGDVANSSGKIVTFTNTYSELGLAQSRLWPAGTLCITIAANIGKSAVLCFDACFPDSIVGFTPNDRVNVEFIQAWLRTQQPRLEEQAPQSAQKNINLRTLRELELRVPPVMLQNEFATYVAAIHALRAAQSSCRKRLDDLFHSLVQQSFEGEVP
jgi:type I restriction enzyme S subunit